jgi:hypothetical protein
MNMLGACTCKIANYKIRNASTRMKMGGLTVALRPCILNVPTSTPITFEHVIGIVVSQLKTNRTKNATNVGEVILAGRTCKSAVVRGSVEERDRARRICTKQATKQVLEKHHDMHAKECKLPVSLPAELTSPSKKYL